MLKLYKLTDTDKLYWETWDSDGVHTVHWGVLGTRGESRQMKSGLFSKPTEAIQQEINQKLAEGFSPIEEEDLQVLLIEYAIDGMGNAADLAKRHRLQERMDETLGWTGVGHCDGGSIGSGTMEVCCLVADFEVAHRVIEADLSGTEFANYSRIYREDEG